MRLLITGGAGFIGSNFIRYYLARHPEDSIVNLDKLTYAGNLENLAEVEGRPAYRFVKGDICDATLVVRLLAEERPQVVVHFAAESHVDRSILAPSPAFETNLHGTFTLLEAARQYKVERFVHISTDEVYGSLAEPLEADENFPLRPGSPYSAAKAGSDLLALSFYTTYGVPAVVTRASNNYGPYQFPEKFIPLMITNALENWPLPIYGDGRQVRDWLFVEDHCAAIEAVVERGRAGEIYNIGGNCSWENLSVAREILRLTGRPESLLASVVDRPGHDRRYALSSAKIERELGWTPRVEFAEGLARTIEWYRSHDGWVKRVKGGDYRLYYQQHYENREQTFSRL
ncbi:MAG: dTDP-glucose 4,6-dehydratase [Acidobacteria bacterium]|nr:dTDP-glucose 4,6-dehydratase [Acidobacteriota bacterium]